MGTSGTQEAEKPEDSGVEMDKEELLAQRKYSLQGSRSVHTESSYFPESGIIVFNVISGQLTKKARVEMLLDDGYWPCFSTNRARSTKASWGYVGEGFVRELDFSQVWIRLNDAEEGDKDVIVAEWRGDTKSFLSSTLASVFFELHLEFL